MDDEILAALDLAADAVMGYERVSVAERVKASFAIRALIERERAGGERAKVVAWLRKQIPDWRNDDDAPNDAASALWWVARKIEAGAHMEAGD